MIEQLVSRVFATRNLAHLRHWSTDNFAEHMALGEFYDEVIDAVDSLVEKYQGFYTKIGPVTIAAGSTPDNIITVLTADALWINKNRSTISKGNATLENFIDELEGVYLETLYKLRFLH